MALARKFNNSYRILEKISTGSATEVFLAIWENEIFDHRLVILKKVNELHRDNPDVYEEFEREIKKALTFKNKNTAAVYEVGYEGGSPFLVMEFIEGENLRDYCRQIRASGHKLDIPTACSILIEVCNALSQMHEFYDPTTGEMQCHIHRNLSPVNIMVSYDGEVKLIDYGVAKNRTSTQVTRIGYIKGTPAYLSPEQVEALPVDGRSDQFSIGIMLWELLTKKSLFFANSEVELMEVVRTFSASSPSQSNSEIPIELDKIVLRSLSKNRELRFETIRDFQYALSDFLLSAYPKFNFMKSLWEIRNALNPVIIQNRKRRLELIRQTTETEEFHVISDKSPNPGIDITGIDQEKTQTNETHFEIAAVENSMAPDAPFADDENVDKIVQPFKDLGMKSDEAESIGQSTGTNEAIDDDVDKSVQPFLDPSISVASNFAGVSAPKTKETTAEISEPTEVFPQSGDFQRQNDALHRINTLKKRNQEESKISTGTRLGSMSFAVASVALIFAGYKFKNNYHPRTGSIEASSPRSPAASQISGNLTMGYINFDGEPLKNIKVLIDGEHTTPDEQGRFSAPLGKPIVVEVLKPGYEDFQFRPTLTAEYPDLKLSIPFFPERPKGSLSLTVRKGAVFSLYLENVLFYEGAGSTGKLPLAIGNYLAVIKSPTKPYLERLEFTIKEGENVELE